jgi:signal transduction histidine kinase
VNAGSSSQPLAADARRLAREVHDVLGHHLSAIAVHADLGRRRLAEGDHAGVEESLALMRETAAAALAQTRDWIGLVRERPAPSLAERLEELARPARAAGLTVAVRETGRPAALGPALGECVERIVQESLTNVMRHAGASRVDVVVRYRRCEVQVTVVDDGRDDASPGRARGGQGLVGMRERAAEAGGRLFAGPDARGGWRVSARLPL